MYKMHKNLVPSLAHIFFIFVAYVTDKRRKLVYTKHVNKIDKQRGLARWPPTVKPAGARQAQGVHIEKCIQDMNQPHGMSAPAACQLRIQRPRAYWSVSGKSLQFVEMVKTLSHMGALRPKLVTVRRVNLR